MSQLPALKQDEIEESSQHPPGEGSGSADQGTLDSVP